MKIFRVVTELDGNKRKETREGVVSNVTEINRLDRRFAANSIDQVIDVLSKYLQWDETLIAVLEEHPSVIILDEQK